MDIEGYYTLKFGKHLDYDNKSIVFVNKNALITFLLLGNLARCFFFKLCVFHNLFIYYVCDA